MAYTAIRLRWKQLRAVVDNQPYVSGYWPAATGPANDGGQGAMRELPVTVTFTMKAATGCPSVFVNQSYLQNLISGGLLPMFKLEDKKRCLRTSHLRRELFIL